MTRKTSTPLQIHSAFDSGNIIVDKIDGNTAHLRIHHDHDSDFYQWFHFRVTAEAGQEVELRITDMAGSAYPGGWPGYDARCSDVRGAHWWTADSTTYDPKADNGTLTIFCKVGNNIACIIIINTSAHWYSDD